MKKQTLLMVLLAILVVSCIGLVGCAELFHTHEFGEWTPLIIPNCTTDGLQVRYCSCGGKQVEPLYTTGHNYESAVTNPTCWERGYTTYTCLDCSEIYVDNYTNTISHTYSNDVCTACNFGAPSVGLSYTLSEDGTYYILIGIGTCTDAPYVIIPSEHEGKPVAIIARSAFANCYKLQVVVIPESIVYIGKYTFWHCENLTSITFKSPLGWYYAQVENHLSVAFNGGSKKTDLLYPTSNANDFTRTYVDYYWFTKDGLFLEMPLP